MDDLLEERFRRASERMRQNTRLKLSNEQKLDLYALFKQANEGPCNTSKPGMFDFTGRAKWEAWNKLGSGVSKETAMSRYVELVGKVDPEWETQSLDTERLPPSSGGGGGTGGPVVSTLASNQDEEAIPDEKKSVFDWCQEGNISRLRELVTESNVNDKDSQGMALLHWACDRGNLEVVKLLVSIKGADVNIQDSDQQTPLHYAASCDQVDVVSFLLDVSGVDTTLKDCDGCTAEEVAAGTTVKQLFHQSNTS